jgi:hypothetical protein
LISCTHCGPEGGFSTGWESCGGTKNGSGELGGLRHERPALTTREAERLTTRDMLTLWVVDTEGLTLKMLFLVFALAMIFGPAYAQDGHIPGLDKPTDCVMTRIKSIQGRLEGSSPRESGAAVQYENGAYGVQYQLGDNPDKDQPGYSDYWQQKTYEDNIVASRVGDPIKLCLVSIPLHCPNGDGRGREYVALDLRNHRWWNLGDSEHMCGGA